MIVNLNQERALALKEALSAASAARQRANDETQEQADAAAAQVRAEAEAAAAAAQEAATGPAPGSAGAKRLTALANLGIVDGDSHSSLGGSRSHQNNPMKGMQAAAAGAAAAAATQPVSYAAASASNHVNKAGVNQDDNASLGSTISAGVSIGHGGLSAAIVRAAKEERRRQRRQHHLALRLAAEDKVIIYASIIFLSYPLFSLLVSFALSLSLSPFFLMPLGIFPFSCS